MQELQVKVQEKLYTIFCLRSKLSNQKYIWILDTSSFYMDENNAETITTLRIGLWTNISENII